MMAVNFYISSAITTDGSGDGTTSDWNGSFSGKLVGVRYEYSGSTAATADTTLSETNGLKRTLDTVTDGNTNVTRNPAFAVTGATDFYLPYFVDSNNLTVTIAQGGATVTDAVQVTVMIEG